MENPFKQSKNLKKKLELSEIKFQTVAESASDSIIITDENSIIIFANSKVEDMFGYHPQEITGKNLEMIIPEEYRSLHKKGVQRFLQSRTPKIMGKIVEMEALKKNGEIFPIELSLSYWEEENRYFFTGILRDISNRKEAEKKLKESEEKFRLLTENSSDIVSVHTPDGVILYISPSVKTILGYNPEELIGVNAYSLYNPEDLDKMKHAYAEARELKDITTVSFRARKKDGNYIWIESTGRIIRNSEGKPIELHAVNRDISERKEAEKELEESRHFIQRVADSSPTIISVFDILENKSIYSNKEMMETLGYSQEQINSMGPKIIEKLVHPDDRGKIAERNFRLENLKEGDVVETEVRIKDINGNYRWISARTTLFKRTKEGKPWQTLTVSLDVTDRKTAEEKLFKAQKNLQILNEQLESKVTERTSQLNLTSENLRKSENLLQIVANILPAFISYIDRDGFYRFANDYYLNLPFIINSPVGKHMKEVIGEKTYKENQQYMECALKGETPRFMSRLKLKDGSEKNIQGLYLPDKDENGYVRGFVVMGIDLTERMNYEKELNSRNEELKRINNDLDNFIYTASHDLKAPVANIEGLINAVKETEAYQKDMEVKDLIELMELSTERFKNTIIDLTEISRIQSGRHEKDEEIELNDMLDEIKFLLKDLIKTSGAMIKTDFVIPKIRFSSRNMRSILFNLLSNALKYRSPERVTDIRLGSGRNEEGISIYIQDNGLGIPTDRQDQLFRMFKRFHDHVEGSGVGLFIVKRIVENAGGKIYVQSEENVGTTFRIILPLSDPNPLI